MSRNAIGNIACLLGFLGLAAIIVGFTSVYPFLTGLIIGLALWAVTAVLVIAFGLQREVVDEISAEIAAEEKKDS